MTDTLDGFTSVLLSKPWLEYPAGAEVRVDPLRAEWLRQEGYTEIDPIHPPLGELSVPPTISEAALPPTATPVPSIVPSHLRRKVKRDPDHG